MMLKREPPSSMEPAESEPSASTSSSESRLLKKARRGSRGAAEALFGRYGSWLRRCIRGRLPLRVRGSIDTSDVVQETLRYTFARLEWFKSKRASSLRAYLRRVAENRIRDELRRATRRRATIAPEQPLLASEDGAPQSLLRKACSAEFLPEAAGRARVSGRDAAFAG